MTAENELLNQKFPRASSHGVYWENKMYKLKRYRILSGIINSTPDEEFAKRWWSQFPNSGGKKIGMVVLEMATNPLLPMGQRAQEQNNTASSLFLVQHSIITLAPAMGLNGPQASEHQEGSCRQHYQYHNFVYISFGPGLLNVMGTMNKINGCKQLFNRRNKCQRKSQQQQG